MKPLGDFITRRIVTAVLFGVGVRRKGAGHDIHYKHIPIRQLGGRIETGEHCHHEYATSDNAYEDYLYSQNKRWRSNLSYYEE